MKQKTDIDQLSQSQSGIEEARVWFDRLLSGADRDMRPDRDVDGRIRGSARYFQRTGLDPDVVEEFCKGNDIDVTTFFNGVFAFVLSRFTFKEDALYTSICSGPGGQDQDSGEAMQGRFIPVTIPIAPDRRVGEFLNELSEQIETSKNNNACSFAEISQSYGISTDVIFVCIDGNSAAGGQAALDLSGPPAEWNVEPASPDTDIADTPILFQVIADDEGYAFDCSYRCDIYSEGFMRIFSACMEKASEDFLKMETLGEVDMLTKDIEGEMDRFNETEMPVEKSDMVSVFRAAVEKYPNNTAVIFRDIQYTYRQADDITERIAGYLRARDIGRGDVVSILIPRCEYMPIAAMGVLKSGAAYQPLDPGYPSERLSFMMADADCKLLIADEDLLEKVPDYDGPVLLIKDILGLPPCDRIEDHPDPDDLFILLYTSGSTGTPKGVMIEHHSIANFVTWYRDYFQLDETCRVSAYSSYGFDSCMMDLYAPLANGACICIIPEEIRLDLIAVEALFNKMGITHCFMTTQVARQFYTMANVPTLKHLITGGEKLVPVAPRDDVTTNFCNGYGPTECTIFTTTAMVDKLYERVPIGKPLGNYKCYVVDENMRRLPPLVPGELLISGRGLARGYLNQPELTAKAFVDNPFTDDPDYAHALRSGDIVRLLPDGNIDFIGRKDSQVKVRGFRIELAEIESVIREFPGIDDATVQAFEDKATGEKFITAYIVAEEEIDVVRLDEFIGNQKPAYMIPAVTMQIPSIPLNQNQKVNKRELPQPELRPRREAGSEGNTTPLNMLENQLKNIVSEIVNLSDFEITDHFRDLGLTSISGIRLAVQLHKAFGIQFNGRELAAEGSLQSVENDILTFLLGGGEKRSTGKSEERQRLDSAHLSFAQQGVYADCEANPDAVRYNLPFELRFPDAVDAEQLKRAVIEVIEAHPYILCRFVNDDNDDIIQKPIPDYTPEIPILEMSEEEYEAHRADFVRPFDLAQGPMIRFEIIKTDQLILLADMHHLVSDGASMDLFFDQLCRVLDGNRLAEEDYTYYDYVADEEMTPEVEKFFEGKMSEMSEATQLIPDVFQEGLPHMEKTVSVPTDIISVREFAQQNGVTPAAVYLAATYIAYGRYVCEDTVSIATISSGRSNLKISETMGMFVNTLPLVMTLDHKEETLSFLRRVAKDFSNTIEHENYPFARIASKFDFHPSASYTYQIGVINEYSTGYGPVSVESLDSDIAKLPVGIYIEGTEEDARIDVVYDSAMYSEDMMKGLARSVENAVKGLLQQDSLDHISLTDEEQWKVMDGFNRPLNLDYDRSDTVVSVFRRNAKMQPDKVAAVFKDKEYTYRELDELTDRLAGKLYRRVCEIRGKTDLAEEVVSILLHRDENVFILPLATVKAGMAYEPLDPSYPRERLNFMVRDAGAALLLGEGDLLDLVDEYDGPVLTVEELYEMEEVPEIPKGPSPEDLFIMLYTSGTTGVPKGCQIEHRNLVAYAHGLRNEFCTRDDRLGAYASFGFDVNMEDVFCTLQNGGTVCLIPEEVRMDLGKLADYFDEAGVTALLLTTQVGVQFIQSYPKLKTLRLLVLGGEKLPAIDPSDLSYTVANGYGPTENCCGVSIFPVREWEPNVPLGRPFDTILGYVLDKTGHRLPPGAAGEYCVSGPQVMRGYLNRPGKTAEAFEPCPFNEFRMYHTGDIVRYRQNGDVEFVGRKDGQVKIRGFRVETKEVETVIRGFEGIRDVTVQAYDYESGGKYLAAFVVGDAPVDIDGLRTYIRDQKPAYMVPAAIMQIEEVPLNVNQKVDKKALPKPELLKAAYVAPEGKAEEDFCEIFCNVLGIDRMGAEDDFFESGGSSILAMKVVIAAGKAGYSIVYNDVFSHTTPRGMAAFVTGESPKPKAAAEEKPVDECAPLPNVDDEGYDYTKIHQLLSLNTMDAFRNGDRLPLNDVLLLGPTGYLGSHVLKELIDERDVKIYCIVRPGPSETGEQRLKDVLKGYFGNDHADLFGDRIIVIEGDSVDSPVLDNFNAPSENMTVINCAASVKHFARGDEIERANVGSVQKLTEWCEKHNARLVHISTGSVMGCRKNGYPTKNFRLDEHILYGGQEVRNNQYIHSKFLAERHIYEEMLENGLRAKVLRVGNLAPRERDGEFQKNFRTNSFMNTLKAFRILGMVSYDVLGQPTEFSPIDCVAKAVIELSATPEECVCFIPLNPHRPLMGDIIRSMNEAGYPIKAVENDEFAQALEEALLDENRCNEVSNLIAYDNNEDIQEIGIESIENTLTVSIMSRLALFWPETGSEYNRRFLSKLEYKGFFED